jgi:hypothetical protein
MYCPTCFNDTLKIKSSGVIRLFFNGKTKSNAQIFYNLNTDSGAKIREKLKKVIEDYFKFYGSLANKIPVERIDAFSLDFKCENKCNISLDSQLSVIDLIIPAGEMEKISKEMSQKYQVQYLG